MQAGSVECLSTSRCLPYVELFKLGSSFVRLFLYGDGSLTGSQEIAPEEDRPAFIMQICCETVAKSDAALDL